MCVCKSNSISDSDGIDDDAKYENSCDRRERTALPPRQPRVFNCTHDAPMPHTAHTTQVQRVIGRMYYYLSIGECNHARHFPNDSIGKMQSANIAIVFASVIHRRFFVQSFSLDQ